MNDHHHTPPPAPTAECPTFAPQLALLGSDSLAPETEAETRAHLATCAWCSAKLANFAIVDAALIRHFGSAQSAVPRLALEQIMIADDDEPTKIDEWEPRPLRAPRRGPTSAILAMACTIALVVAASVIFSALPHGSGGSTGPVPSVTPQSSAPPTVAPTATPLSPCGLLTGGGTPFQSLASVPALVLPTGTYISSETLSGGGTGLYTVHSYTVCYPGDQEAVAGNVLTPNLPSTSSLSLLEQSGWNAGELFPSQTDYMLSSSDCFGSRYCLNDAGTPNPFTFLAVDQFFRRTGNLTTFRLQVATIAAPTCLNDAKYYSGTPRYTLYVEGNAPDNGTYFFFMPSATRVSSFKDSGTGSSHVMYFCSPGTSVGILNYLEGAMLSNSWSITKTSVTTFTATKGNNPRYRVDVNTANPGNYSLRIYNPA